MLCVATSLQAQKAYLDAQYDVQVTQDVIYGVNATILPVLFQISTEAVPRPLNMDVYTPIGNDDPDKPVMLVFHTGNFLPFPQNNGTGGTIRDSTVVEACMRLASRGYVAAAVDYRLGWNPLDPSQDIRKFFLINAAYRGIQDARTCVRYFRKTAVDGGNPYGIDPSKIGLWGIGTGGYIVAGCATIDEYAEIVIPKFIINFGGGPVPMVIQQVNGDINGTSVGIVPPGYPVLPAGDTLCYPNHVTYADGSAISSDVSLVVNNGGALGDISWIDENTVPWVSFHVPNDPFAPYTTGTLTVPGTGDPADPSDDFAVVEVSGSYDIQTELNALGINAMFDNVGDLMVEDYSSVANMRNDGLNGLFPMPNNTNNESAPWDFYAPDNPNVPPNPAPEPVVARMYWDTIMAYALPRACLALNLDCTETSVNELNAQELGLKIAPNPAAEFTVISTDLDFPIRTIEVFDANGRLVSIEGSINSNQYTLDRGQLTAGIYYLRLRFDEGINVQKLILN